MNKIHVALIAGLLALAAVLGTLAATRTVSLGASGRHASDAAVAARTRQLDAYAASLRRALAHKPPALPAASAATLRSGPVRTPRVIYHRPPPIVVVKHRTHGDEGGAEGHGDD